MSGPPRVPEDRSPADADWTFSPDQAFVHPEADSGDGAEPGPDALGRSRARISLAPRVGVIVIVGALITGGLAVAQAGPFHSSPRVASSSSGAGLPTDIRGTWNALMAFNGSLYVQTLHVTTEGLRSGAFSGTITSPVGVETMKGSVVGSAVSFTARLGHDTESGTATVSTDHGRLLLKGVFSNSAGGQGTITATRTSP